MIREQLNTYLHKKKHKWFIYTYFSINVKNKRNIKFMKFVYIISQKFHSLTQEMPTSMSPTF